jgi:hypothetical protein
MKRDFTITEAVEQYPILQRIYQHFRDHRILTDEDFEKMCKGETQNQARRDLAEVFGGELKINSNRCIKKEEEL